MDNIVKNNCKMSLNDFLHHFDKILVPSIQRDYVMGSGGTKLKKMLQKMDDDCKEGHLFNFSCIMGHKETNNNETKFYIYDGQQRLTTLIYLSAYILSKSTDDRGKYKEQLEKFEFVGRNKANEYLKSLLSNQEKKLEICDFTTYSISKLFDTFFNNNRISNYHNINVEFLMEKIVFDVVIVKEMGDAEQFFMDLNDGLDLKEYEIFKAELNHKIYAFLDSEKMLDNEEYIKKWCLKIDNEWLEYFLPFKTERHCEEEIEIGFIKFFLKMLYLEKYGSDKGFKSDDLSWVKEEHIKKIYNIMQNLININIMNHVKESSVGLNFSWTNNAFTNLRGVYWNLSDENYEAMLYKFICSFQKNPYNDTHRKLDVLIWSYVSNLDVENEKRNTYLRFIKKMLNANRVVNDEAWYTENKIWFCKYSTFGIPEYYGNTFVKKGDKNNEEYIWNVVSLNQYFREGHKCEFKDFVEAISILIDKHKLQNDKIKKILVQENFKYRSVYYKEITKFENLELFNGLVNNILDEKGKPLITFDDFINKIGKNNMIFNLLHDLSKVVKSFDEFLVQDIKIKWDVSGGYTSYQTGKIPLQCLTDFFTHSECKWKETLQNYLNSKTVDNTNIEVQFYLKYYEDIPTGWYSIYGDYQMCYPHKGDNGSLLSATSKTYDNPIAKIKNAKHWFECMFYKISSNGLGDILIGREVEPNAIKFQHEWLKDLIINKDYKEIYFSENQVANTIILKGYIENNKNGIEDIQRCIDENYDIVRKVFDKFYFIIHKSLKDFMHMYMNK
ncbi:DUF262 domain-containing protein [Clostridium botulinum]|uniref:DUF262 domain-containing protein n=1 Tax=Clostridium botulinum TaxID=1491 RepID=UPI001E44AD4F|nr:DUF262 domain-containing protein [Clostridium botulinum]MCD3276628.1 DUF262 domain-containing protein [Clostridium botulinum C/D]MCD3288214.1 DUF262 domain-containing protein [Clostridium botulinum C/D]MCD3291783.1 DUF262 domain-containing protein [Clostridium botulinum C/D]MCD3301771.1 DUF262 domain-containing protein [Clostridium botulinum C/D]